MSETSGVITLPEPYDVSRVQIFVDGVKVQGSGLRKFRQDTFTSYPQISLGITSPSLAHIEDLKDKKFKLLVQYQKKDGSKIVFFNNYVKVLHYVVPEGFTVDYPYVDVLFIPTPKD